MADLEDAPSDWPKPVPWRLEDLKPVISDESPYETPEMLAHFGRPRWLSRAIREIARKWAVDAFNQPAPPTE